MRRQSEIGLWVYSLCDGLQSTSKTHIRYNDFQSCEILGIGRIKPAGIHFPQDRIVVVDGGGEREKGVKQSLPTFLAQAGLHRPDTA